MARRSPQTVEHSFPHGECSFCGGALPICEMEGRGMQLTSEAMAILTQKRCNLWPECNCYSFLSLWKGLLSDDEKIWDLADLEVGEDMIFITLCCVQGHCPDKSVRDYANRQLRKSFWDRQRVKSIMDH